ncbi:hypothetical protein [Thalassotalea profundi]|uniref:Uncharacterized protein n=1 Tax=Thalassotalea profundi TaxID=2036687 RepID=A0ABQ3IAD4_9GAMM|nr:hypothetical protein [Thalassotalea profundi]GHE76787.1 hypothetical protein GCM10011501_00130 [Thalassotalea profundi]
MLIKRLTFLFSLCCFTSVSQAKNIDITHRDIIKTHIHNSAPQLFLYNKEGQLIHYSSRYFPAIKIAFNNKKHINGYSDQTEDLLKLINGDEKDFDHYDFTLFFVNMDENIGPCPPCRKQEKIIDKLKSKFKKVKINYHRINIIQETYYID